MPQSACAELHRLLACTAGHAPCLTAMHALSLCWAAGDLAGQYGDLVGTDGGDGIIKLGADIKIMPLADIGRLAVQPEGGGSGAPPPPPA